MQLKKPILMLVSMFLLSSAFAQQDPQYSQVMFNQNTINPGAAGSSDMIATSLINRIQWLGFDGAPRTNALNVNAAVSPFGFKSGVGLNIFSDNPAFNKDLGINLSYAARIKTGKGTLGIGVSGGFISKNLDPKWTPTATGDGAIPQGKESSINLDLGAGIYYNNEEMYFGFSTTHLNGTKMNSANNPARYKRQFYLTGGYILNMPNPSWQFNPSVYAVSDLFLAQISISANIKYNKKFWGGVSYRMGRLGDAITGMIGIELFNGLKIGYAYEFSMREISAYNDGSHELMLGYTFSLKKERPPQQYKSIRFL